jgi:hypothetical protein
MQGFVKQKHISNTAKDLRFFGLFGSLFSGLRRTELHFLSQYFHPD